MSCMTPLRVLCDVASGLSPEAFRCLRYSAIYAPDMLPRPRTLPSGFIPPCLPTKAPRPPSGAMWLHEIKHDGFRVIARKDGARVKLYSRPGNDLTWRFSLIVEAVGRLRSRSCIIDGEAVACDDNGDDLRRDPLVVRKATLASVLAKVVPGIRFNDHMEFEDGETVFRHACRLGLEGIVSKRKDSTYRSGRSSDWLKMKNPACEAVKREAEEDWGR